MDLYKIEGVVNDDGSVVVPAVPYAPGTKVLVTIVEAEPMDREAFEAALADHYGR